MNSITRLFLVAWYRLSLAYCRKAIADYQAGVGRYMRALISDPNLTDEQRVDYAVACNHYRRQLVTELAMRKFYEGELIGLDASFKASPVESRIWGA